MAKVTHQPTAISEVTYAYLRTGSVESVSMFGFGFSTPESVAYRFRSAESSLVFEATVGTLLTRRHQDLKR